MIRVCYGTIVVTSVMLGRFAFSWASEEAILGSTEYDEISALLKYRVLGLNTHTAFTFACIPFVMSFQFSPSPKPQVWVSVPSPPPAQLRGVTAGCRYRICGQAWQSFCSGHFAAAQGEGQAAEEAISPIPFCRPGSIHCNKILLKIGYS